MTCHRQTKLRNLRSLKMFLSQLCGATFATLSSFWMLIHGSVGATHKVWMMSDSPVPDTSPLSNVTLQEAVVRSRVDCGRVCLEVVRCASFSYCPSTGVCVLTDSSVTTSSVQVSPGCSHSLLLARSLTDLMKGFSCQDLTKNTQLKNDSCSVVPPSSLPDNHHLTDFNDVILLNGTGLSSLLFYIERPLPLPLTDTSVLELSVFVQGCTSTAASSWLGITGTVYGVLRSEEGRSITGLTQTTRRQITDNSAAQLRMSFTELTHPDIYSVIFAVRATDTARNACIVAPSILLRIQ